MREIFLAGYPSYLGGADLEALHLIDLWRMHDVAVHLVPMFACDENVRADMDAIGCITHEYHPKIFENKTVVSFCNGQFLSRLPEIVEQGKPARTIWFNCMLYTFAAELIAHQNKWIDQFGFVSSYQKSILKPKLEAVGPVVEFEGYKPFFNPNNITQKVSFQYNIPQDWFALGRISRDDASKYSTDMWDIYYKVCVPKHKKIFILGYGQNAKHKTGAAPAGLDWQTWPPNYLPVKEIYNKLHCIIHKTGGSRESYCRIVPEAYAYGVPIITEDDYAFPDLIINGVTGYRCKSSDEMSFRASELAFDEEKRKRMIFAAKKFLENEIASVSKCWECWEKLFKE